MDFVSFSLGWYIHPYDGMAKLRFATREVKVSVPVLVRSMLDAVEIIDVQPNGFKWERIVRTFSHFGAYLDYY